MPTPRIPKLSHSLYNFGRWDGTSTYTDESGLGDAWMKIYLS